MKKVIITGVSGQDGSNMIDYLLARYSDIKIYGVIRRLSVPNHRNIEHLKSEPCLKLIQGDISDAHSMSEIIQEIKPEYFINFAANSFVGSSWAMPEMVLNTNTMAVLHQLEAIRKHSPLTRYYQAGSSEEFGDSSAPQSEKTPPSPRSPYGVSKVASRNLVKVYRESYGIYAVCGWLFNHEGVRRGEEFVTRKITKGVARIKCAIDKGLPFEPIELGNIEAKRDWSDSEDFVDGVWRMLNQELWNPNLSKDSQLWREYIDNSRHLYRNEDARNIIREEKNGHHLIHEYNYNEFLARNIKEYVLASNETHTIREFIELAFQSANIHGNWRKVMADADPLHEVFHGGNHVNEAIVAFDSPGILVRINPKFYRPAEVNLLLGDSTNIRKDLGWKPRTGFKDLVKKMVEHDIA
jgi:GDPmannose 4,6-dehydratase